ncbi:MAG: sigma-54-dependent transcriptional regulator [Gemmatimonadales bacterium]
MASILVVDDEPGIREFLVDALAVDGHVLDAAPHASGALTALSRRAFDLLLTDIRMPGEMDGMGLVRRVRADYPEMDVVVLTAHGTVPSAVEAIKLGVFDFLVKPVAGPSELRRLVGRAVERRRLLVTNEAQRIDRRLPPLSYGDPIMVSVVRALERVAPTQSSVLLLGESGTGKELAAQLIHENSPRSDGPFVAINCAAITDSLMESEMFGHERGAFTGATVARRGRLELADGGTVFLDEVGELKPELQAKLLRVVQERCFERVGGNRTIEVNVRWIAATNRDLEAEVRAGRFREDLYYRLAVFPVRMPPLRERRHDLIPLAERLLVRVAASLNRPPLSLDDDARSRILAAPWPGNIRQLANALERAAILAEGNEVRGVDLEPAGQSVRGTGSGTLEELERDAIERTLIETGGHRRRAAERLGIGERTLYEKLKRYQLS